ncbi:MAG: 3-deoxy-7-phosphoheptulonate synthase [Ignavibacteriae bacterium]|nr:3-deoxy-7-phosphoheptulonate synthase [Ignavibacteriota bacterium]NOG99389.1 3-deoxy-7-phosphoheptulonate synthase [Ignavibacteriota bacterium]
MVIILKHNATDEQVENIKSHLINYGFQIHESKGEQKTILGAIGVKPNFDTRKVKILEGVAEVYRVTAPYKLTSRDFKTDNTIIKIGDYEIGGNKLVMMTGPCSVESEDQIYRLAKVVAESGSKILRGGAFKPRSSPYSFQGLGEEGLKFLRGAADENELFVITEVMQISQIDLIEKYTDIFQLGARNMQNFALLKELGNTQKPVMIKRGLSATIEEWLMSAEYILSAGNPNVILCERGIRTFETYTRNTFDLSAIPIVHNRSHLPVIADPSHATGLRDQVPPMARAAVAAGADGLMIEIHDDPENALSDGPQALLPANFLTLVEELKSIAKAINREV